VASSADGTRLIAAAGYGQLYTSTNSGVAWVPRESARYWWAVASSADGGKLLAAVNGGQLYTWPQQMLAGAQNSTIELQYLGNGRWQPVNNPNFIVGNLGVGTLAPARKIHVVAPDARLRLESTSGDAATEYQTDAGSWQTGVGSSSSSNNLSGKYYIYDANAGQTRMVVDGYSGGVGIGTTSPAGALDVRTSGASMVVNDYGVGIGTFSPGAMLDVRTTNVNGNALRFGFYTGGAGNLIAGPSRVGIATDSMAEKISINQGSGYVGINTISPQTQLHVFGPEGAQLQLQNNANFKLWNLYSESFNNSGNMLFVPGAGSGFVYFSTAGVVYGASDKRLKRDITPLGSVLDRVMQLRPVAYHFREEAKDAPRTLGLIAQEVEPLFPEAVGEHAGMKSLAYSELVPVAIGAVQELNQKFTAELKRRDAENAELKRELAELKNVVAKLVERQGGK